MFVVEDWRWGNGEMEIGEERWRGVGMVKKRGEFEG